MRDRAVPLACVGLPLGCIAPHDPRTRPGSWPPQSRARGQSSPPSGRGDLTCTLRVETRDKRCNQKRDGEERVMSSFSRATRKDERKWDARELEVLALIATTNPHRRIYRRLYGSGIWPPTSLRCGGDSRRIYRERRRQLPTKNTEGMSPHACRLWSP